MPKHIPGDKKYIMNRAMEIIDDKSAANEEAPVVQAKLCKGGKTVSVRCPYCGDTHVHGIRGIPDFRLSHCEVFKPYFVTLEGEKYGDLHQLHG